MDDGNRAQKLQEMLGKTGNGNGGGNDASWPDSPQVMDAAGFDSTVKQYSVCVVDFWANRCQPCRMMEPVVHQLAKDYQGKVFFGKVNTDENIELTNKLGIRSIPTFCVFKDSELVQKAEGIIPRNEFEAMLKPYL